MTPVDTPKGQNKASEGGRDPIVGRAQIAQYERLLRAALPFIDEIAEGEYGMTGYFDEAAIRLAANIRKSLPEDRG